MGSKKSSINYERRRSSSLSTLYNIQLSDDENYWSACSSRKTSKDLESKKKISLSTVKSAADLNDMKFNKDKSVTIDHEYQHSCETLVNNEYQNIQNLRMFLFKPDSLSRRQSTSLPGFQEGLNSGKLVSRLSLVGDELEESLKNFRESNSANRRRWTIFDSLAKKGH